MVLKIGVLQDRKIHCLQARPCIFQPGNLTSRGSEGVKRVSCDRIAVPVSVR